MRTDLNSSVITYDSTQVFDGNMEMTISQNAMAHIAYSFSNIYNDPILAVIREYIANAIDATRDNGGEIEIICPTEDRPTFVVRDFGTGMSFDTVSKVFSTYFESTKNTSSDEIGGWGIGAKSALAIADQFAVTTTHNGETVKMGIEKSDVGLPTIRYIRLDTPDKPNGTSVAIPVEVQDVYAFRNKIEGFLWLLNEGNISKVYNLDNYEDKADTSEDGFSAEIGDESTVTILGTGPVPHDFYLRMGGIYYRIPIVDIPETGFSNETRKTIYAMSDSVVIVDAPIDSVDLAPNREGVRFTDKTKEFLTEAITNIHQVIRDKVVEFIESSPTFEEARQRFRNFGKIDPRNESTWDGIDLRFVNYIPKGFSIYEYNEDSNVLRGPKEDFRPHINYYSHSVDWVVNFIKVLDDVSEGKARKTIRDYITAKNKDSSQDDIKTSYFVVYDENSKDENTEEAGGRYTYSQKVCLDDARKILGSYESHELNYSDMLDVAINHRKNAKKSSTSKRNNAKQNRLSRQVLKITGPEYGDLRYVTVEDLVDEENVFSFPTHVSKPLMYGALTSVMDDFTLLAVDTKTDRKALEMEVPGYRHLELEDINKIVGIDSEDISKDDAESYIQWVIATLVLELNLPQELVDKIEDPIIKDSLKNFDKNDKNSALIRLRAITNRSPIGSMNLINTLYHPEDLENQAHQYGIETFDKLEERTAMLRHIRRSPLTKYGFSDEAIVNYINADYAMYRRDNALQQD